MSVSTKREQHRQKTIGDHIEKNRKPVDNHAGAHVMSEPSRKIYVVLRSIDPVIETILNCNIVTSYDHKTKEYAINMSREIEMYTFAGVDNDSYLDFLWPGPPAEIQEHHFLEADWSYGKWRIKQPVRYTTIPDDFEVPNECEII